MARLGISTANTTAYHPQANGLVERMHRQLKSALKARLEDQSWMDDLPYVLLGIRSAWKETAGVSPAELIYGLSLRLPGQFVSPSEDEVEASDSCLLYTSPSPRD